MSAIFVRIAGTRGSTPRETGVTMKVTTDATLGTIGGGALEWEAIRLARAMLADGREALERTVPLGPDLGQCCGGSVRLDFSRRGRVTEEAAVRPLPPGGPSRDLWVWGAGHVGRAVVAAGHAAFRIIWIDTTRDRFPRDVPEDVTVLPAMDMPLLATRAPRHADHLILTFSHEIDLALCAALLRRGFGSCGLIGSDTKRARFSRRLRAMALDPAPIRCPIGDKALGKAPSAIAQGALADLLSPPGLTGMTA